MDSINVLYELEHLSEVSFIKNPICIHRELRQMIMDAAPQIEIINKKVVKEAGHVFK